MACEHGRSECAKCGGPGICEHKRRRRECGLCDGKEIYLMHLRKSALRGLLTELTESRYRWLVSLPCVYCNEPSGGVDRKDNEYGYTLDNSLPCCATCNYKKHTQNASEFVAHIAKIFAHTSTNEAFESRCDAITQGGPDCQSMSFFAASATSSSSNAKPLSTSSTASIAANKWTTSSAVQLGLFPASTEKGEESEEVYEYGVVSHAPESEVDEGSAQ